VEKKRDSHILFCHCAYTEILPQQTKNKAIQALRESGVFYTAVPDLCELVARKSSLLAKLADEARLVIAACHPRAIQWLFAAADAPIRIEEVECLDMRNGTAEQILCAINELPSAVKTADGKPSPLQKTTAIVSAGKNSGAPEWRPWFPVIDYGRCKNCQQCLGFCLFGVYGVDGGGKVFVKNPTSCKTDCPACARVCPESAIIFPKYPNAPINGGELKDGESFEPVKVDIAAMTRGDVLLSLRERSQRGGRFSQDPGRLKAAQKSLAILPGSQPRVDIPISTLAMQPPRKKEPE